MARSLSPLIRFGTSTWTYGSWQGALGIADPSSSPHFECSGFAVAIGEGVLPLGEDTRGKLGRPWGGVKDQGSEGTLFPSPLYGLWIGTEKVLEMATIVGLKVNGAEAGSD